MTLGPPTANDKDKASWQQMVKRWEERRGKKEVKGTWLQTIDKWDSELKKTKMRVLVVYTSTYIQVVADFEVQHESETIIQLLQVMSHPRISSVAVPILQLQQ